MRRDVGGLGSLWAGEGSAGSPQGSINNPTHPQQVFPKTAQYLNALSNTCKQFSETTCLEIGVKIGCSEGRVFGQSLPLNNYGIMEVFLCTRARESYSLSVFSFDSWGDAQPNTISASAASVYCIYSLTKRRFKGFLLNFLKAALCRPPRLVPPGMPHWFPQIPNFTKGSPILPFYSTF